MSQSIKILLNEALLIKSYENELNELFILFEDEGPITFEWDIAKEKLDNIKSDIKTPRQAELFLKTLLEKVKILPKFLKIKMVRYVIIGFIGLLSIDSITNMLNTSTPDIKNEILTTIKTNKGTPNKKTPNKKTKTPTPTHVSDSLINFIKNEEGSAKNKGEPVLTAYKLGDKKVTIGWGHAEKIKTSQFEEGQTISRAEAENLLSSDIKKAEKAINDILSSWDKKGIEYNINQDMYDAMVSMAFNMGRSGIRTSEFIQLVKQGKYDEAKEKIKTTNVTWGGHKPRREKEANLFATGLKKLNKTQG